MINKFEKQMLEKSLEFLNVSNTEPITLSKLQQIINHANEEFESLDEVKFKYVIENPEGQEKVIFGITTYDYIEELNVISFKTERNAKFLKNFSKNSKVKEVDTQGTISLVDLENIINECKEGIMDWGSVMIAVENLFYPNMYSIIDNSVYIKIGEN